MNRFELHVGDCLDVLRTMPDATVDALVCDPPYGLGTREPAVEEIVAYLEGARLDTGGDFMGTRWEIPPVAVWREAFRVLKPGAHALAFGGTRTFDLMALGLRAAGFELRDTISVDGVFRWVHAQGFPKSVNLGDGRGSALKPAWEPVLVFRKPFRGTLATCVEANGTGALNIGRCRIGWDAASLEKDEARRKAPRTNIKGEAFGAGEGEGEAGAYLGRSDSPPGRHPANVLLSHMAECERVGTRKVRSAPHGPNAGTSARTLGRMNDDGWTPKGHAVVERAEGGQETVEAWRCASGCPVAELDRQSGDRPGMAGGGAHRAAYEGGIFGSIDSTATARGDRGGASRFYFCAKASASERVEHVDENDHPTVKPLELMRWLVRLVSPKGGLVLDTHMGSGTTGVAALLEGLHFVGIELDPSHAATARARIANALGPLFAASVGGSR